ncbi:MAG: EAL domain-containing protein, partial [Ruminococcus sp.]|nr:EAL domain-containing protein [Ruminococcus sp.]
WIRLSCRSSEVQEDGCELIYCSVVDVTESRNAEKELKKQNLMFQMIAENSDEIFFEYDVQADIFTSTSKKLIERYGTDTFHDYVAQQKAEQYMHPDFREPYNKALSDVLAHQGKGTFDYRTKAYDDDYHWYRIAYVSVGSEQDKVTNIYGMIYSIDHMKAMTNKIAEDKVEIERLSSSDHVTGLLTRPAFTVKAAEMLREYFPQGGCLAIGYSDINDFSYVNENFGYEAGDEMLHDFAEVIRQTPGTLCGSRVYSDFFVSLYRADSREEMIKMFDERNSKFNKRQKEKYPLSDIQVSCGIYFLRSPDEDMAVAIDNANLARRSIKGTSDVPCGIYTDRMRKKRSHDQAIASQIWSAINSGAIELFLQPKFDLSTREIIGAEALTRWRNPDGSYKLPYEFIDVLENVGYITQVDLYIYEQVLKCLKRWKDEGKKLIPISVNFSRKHNTHANFVDTVNALADFYGVDKSLIEIEVTESCFTQDVKNLFTNMRRLREDGFKIDIDDFGTGYSSLSVLIDAPVDIVKVDKVFIDNIESDEKSRDYIAQICNLIQSTSKDIIFEGVETEEQARILLGSGHSMAQGWLFDKAIPVDQFDDKYLK